MMHEQPARCDLRFASLPPAARAYVVAVIAAGAAAAAARFPTRIDRPILFGLLLVFGWLTSTWKVNLPLALKNGSTLSVSYAADLMSLLLLGPPPAMAIAIVGAWAQCAQQPKKSYPPYRTIFSVAVVAVTMQAVSIVYEMVNGTPAPASAAELTKPLVAVIATYFAINTALVALAIALAMRRPVWTVWRDNFLWSAPSFMVAGGAGALAAVVIARGDYWVAPLILAPVYLTYRTYKVFLASQVAERALRLEKERLAVTLRSIGDGVIATDTHGLVRIMNPAAEALTGWPHDAALARPLDEIYRPIFRDGVVHGMLASRSGRHIPIHEVRAPLTNDGGQHVGSVVAFRDVSDAIRMQEERTRASKLESLGLLAGGIAHDFNNILTAILGNVSLVRADARIDIQSDGALADAERACVRARQLTQQLLTFAKGGAPIKKPLRVERVIRESVHMALSGSTVSCAMKIDPALWAVNADEGQLIQVLNNILINAQQAMPRGGRVVIRAENVSEPVDRWEQGIKVVAGPYSSVSISDEGAGIGSSHLGRIFEPYYSTKPTGSGLGLATALSIVRNHHGYIAVDSEPGRGTTVRVALPALLAETFDEHAPADTVSPSRGYGRVLVLDDEEPIRTLAVKLLHAIGYDVDAVATGRGAIELYTRAREERRPFDVVLLDLTLPGEAGGREVLRQLRTIDPAVKAIVVSGYASDPVLANYRDYGFNAMIAKPFTLRELTVALDEVIASEHRPAL